MTGWDIDEARRLYNIAHWSAGYFDINSAGHLVARPFRDQDGAAIDVYQVTQEIRQLGLTLPVLVRFSDILHDRVRELNRAFAQAIASDDYRGRFAPVYPIKVNQQHSVVAEILGHSDDRVGLEAGSKPELMAVLAQSRPGGVVVCNGYKDSEYIRLALIGKQLGHQVYVVVEKLSELELLIEQARALEVEPLIGYVPTLLLGALTTAGSFIFADFLPLVAEHHGSPFIPTALATLFTGFLLLITRRKAITQVLGYLMFENGIFVFGVLLSAAMPLMVEAGVLLDLLVAVFVMGIVLNHINREFSTLNTERLSSLRE